MIMINWWRRAFEQAGALPDMVRVGNEVSSGMLWPDGSYPDSGTRSPEHARPRIMIHINEAANKEATRLFFDKFNRHLIPHDVIGQSYYPWWHGSLLDLRDNLAFMSETYRRDIILEVADNCRQGEYLNMPGPFPESPQRAADVFG
jgi:arabinogalactan endo-1,4-beta-galactosidase